MTAPDQKDAGAVRGLSDGLGVPLPTPAFRTSATGGAFDHAQLRAYGAACVAAAFHTAPTGWLVQYECGGAWEWVDGEHKPNTIAADFEPLYQRRRAPNARANRETPHDDD